jgi:hypothetical protein
MRGTLPELASEAARGQKDADCLERRLDDEAKTVIAQRGTPVLHVTSSPASNVCREVAQRLSKAVLAAWPQAERCWRVEAP